MQLSILRLGQASHRLGHHMDVVKPSHKNPFMPWNGERLSSSFVLLFAPYVSCMVPCECLRSKKAGPRGLELVVLMRTGQEA